MNSVALLGIAGGMTALATGLGAVPVFLMGDRARLLRPLLWGVTVGLMSVAAVVGLLLPALAEGEPGPVAAGLIVGVIFLLASRRLLAGRDVHVGHPGRGRSRAVLVFGVLFVHSLPEGFAIGTAYASDTEGLALFVILAIALQNVPEGTSVAIPMESAGFGRAQQFWAAVVTRAPQPVGAIAAYLAVEAIEDLLPFSFAFAAGPCSPSSCLSSSLRPSLGAGGRSPWGDHYLVPASCWRWQPVSAWRDEGRTQRTGVRGTTDGEGGASPMPRDRRAGRLFGVTITAGNRRLKENEASMEDEAREITIVLADDHSVVREGLRVLLEAERGFEVVAEAGTVDAAQRYVLGHKPTVLVLDLNMPGGSSLDAIPQVAEVSPDTSVVVLTMQEDPAFAREALRAGARGYVLKQAAGTELVLAIRTAAEGGTWLNPELGARMAATPDGPVGALAELSEREIEVLRLIALGYTNNEIAEQLFLSVRTVETHRAHIQQKLGLSTRAELVRYALDNDLIER